MKKPKHALAIRFNKRAAHMLVEFVNTHPEAVSLFRRRWETPDGLKWPGDDSSFLRTQQIVRQLWEGKEAGLESFQVALSLGLESSGEPSIPPPIDADWEASELFVAPRDLRDLVWLTVLQHSKRLAICANRGGGCATPYLLKQTPKQRFCSDVCALPAQREFKRQWWNEHGDEWREKRRRKKAKGRKSSR